MKGNWLKCRSITRAASMDYSRITYLSKGNFPLFLRFISSTFCLFYDLIIEQKIRFLHETIYLQRIYSALSIFNRRFWFLLLCKNRGTTRSRKFRKIHMSGLPKLLERHTNVWRIIELIALHWQLIAFIHVLAFPTTYKHEPVGSYL